ncbi:DUF3105 domain-containing protein [Plantactinospora sp. GCM10030261]|uniref:DUF3105 domain-containing protein n=1 Tax=Plantactinospora sp. GCM10030261 TaxID=3273420 RepID=UPI00360AD6D9
MTLHPQRWLWRIGAVVVVATVIALLASGPWRFLVGAVSGSSAAGDQPACPQGETIPIMDSPHISSAEAEKVRYNSLPPTSGPHFAFVLAPGIYADQVPDGLALHALEHGNVVVGYAPNTPPAVVKELERLAISHSDSVVLTPYAQLPNGIALTSWGCKQVLETLDEPEVLRFIEQTSGRYEHGWRRS